MSAGNACVISPLDGSAQKLLHGGTLESLPHPHKAGQSNDVPRGQSQNEAKDVASGAAGEPGECPICLMFKEGGCKKQFDDFMDCGIEAEKGSRDYQDCVKMFDAMRDCMKKNPEVFAHLLADVNEAVSGEGEGIAAEKEKNAFGRES